MLAQPDDEGIASAPLGSNPSHQQSGIEVARTSRKTIRMLKEAALNSLHGQRRNLPCKTLELNTLEHPGERRAQIQAPIETARTVVPSAPSESSTRLRL